MGRQNEGGRDYDLVELVAIKFVLADVIIIAALVFADPIYAVAITALLVLSFVLLWYLTRLDARSDDAAEESVEADPVTTLQERYAAGDLSEAEFEAKLDRLIDANERAEDAGIETTELELERSG